MKLWDWDPGPQRAGGNSEMLGDGCPPSVWAAEIHLPALPTPRMDAPRPLWPGASLGWAPACLRGQALPTEMQEWGGEKPQNYR